MRICLAGCYYICWEKEQKPGCIFVQILNYEEVESKKKWWAHRTA